MNKSGGGSKSEVESARLCFGAMEVDNGGEAAGRTVSFSQVAAVAGGWMLDFSFLSLCRFFKERRFDEFNDSLLILQAITQSPFIGRNDHVQKKMISSILTRVMHGQHLDTQFEEDDRVMPLMSAAVIWSNMRDTVEDEHLFESIATLLIIQSSAVCLEKGERAKASFALTWLKENLDIPQNLQVKLSAICKKGDIYHPFLLNFSFSHLLEMVQTYLDAFQRENPSNFLLQAATKVALSSPEVRNDSVAQEESLADTTNKSTEDSEQKKKSCPGLGQKKKLLWMKNPELQQFVYCKNVKLVLEKLSLKDKNPLNFVQTLPETSQNTTGIKRTKKKWTWALDQKLVKGVRRHGEGKWSRILMDDDFEGRTGTMLKDRWRILKRK